MGWQCSVGRRRTARGWLIRVPRNTGSGRRMFGAPCRVAKFSLAFMETGVRRGILMNGGRGSSVCGLARGGDYFYSLRTSAEQNWRPLLAGRPRTTWRCLFKGTIQRALFIAHVTANATLRGTLVATLALPPSSLIISGAPRRGPGAALAPGCGSIGPRISRRSRRARSERPPRGTVPR